MMYTCAHMHTPTSTCAHAHIHTHKHVYDLLNINDKLHNIRNGDEVVKWMDATNILKTF
jgi:hypothetical protein